MRRNASLVEVAERQTGAILAFLLRLIADSPVDTSLVFPRPGGLLTSSRPTRFPSSVLSRRKKNPSTISRSRSLASCAENRVVLGIGSNVSKAARSVPAWRRNCPYRGQCRADASTLAQWIGDPVKRCLTIGAEAPSRITEPLPSLICRRGWAPLRSVSRAGDRTANICARQNAR